MHVSQELTLESLYQGGSRSGRATPVHTSRVVTRVPCDCELSEPTSAPRARGTAAPPAVTNEPRHAPAAVRARRWVAVGRGRACTCVKL